MDRRNNEPALCMNPQKKKKKKAIHITYRIKNERFVALGEYLPKKDEESDRGFIEGRKIRTKHRKWREKKKKQKNI